MNVQPSVWELSSSRAFLVVTLTTSSLTDFLSICACFLDHLASQMAENDAITVLAKNQSFSS